MGQADLTVTNEGSTNSLLVSWTPPSGVESQEVSWYQANGIDYITYEATLDGSESQYLIENLTAGALYNVTITAYNGTDSSSAEIQGRTLPSQVVLIPGMPTNETVTASWDEPEGVVDSYSITCSHGTASPANTDANSSEALEASCIGLNTAGDEYIMTVTSISGDQTNEASIMLRTLPNRVVLIPGDSTNETVNSSWDKADGVVELYIISCSNGTASPATIDADSDHPVNASCTGLYQVGDEHIMTVISISGDQTNEASIKLFSLPNAVVLVEDISTTDSVSAKWVNPAGLVSSFAIECSNGTASPSSINVTTGAQYMAALPLPPNLQPDVSTKTSVSAVFRHPGGVIEIFEVKCSNGTPCDITEDYLEDEDLYRASYENVSTPGDTYLMTVTSISGRQENPATVNLTALPEAVTLREEASGTTAITASWEVPDSVMDTFIITCSDGSASPSEISITSDQRDDTLTASCIDLTAPGEEYTITVVSRSSGKESMPSSLMIITLPEAVTLREEASNTTSITASWEMPNSVLDTFIITCSDGSASPSEILITSDQRGDTLTASCIDLPTPGDEYAITVVSRSSGKESAPSSLGIIALPEAVTLREEASNTTSITASWEMPNSVLDTFIITCSDGSASPSEILITSDQKGDTLTAACIDLPTPGDEYTITVVSRSSGKESAPSSLGIITLPNGVELREGDSTTTSVSALWEKQKETVDNYKISCSEGNASPPTIPVEDRDLGPFNASCVNLPRPGAVYTMIVFSLDGGTSNSSSTIHLRAVPESVESGTIRDYSTTAVNVEWTLKNCDCVYDEFNLIYEPDGTDPITVAHSNQMMYSAQVTGLTQGRQYIFTVVTISGDSASGPSIQTSEGKTVQQRTIPATATNLVITPDQRRLDLKWTKADGESSGYDITVDPIEGQATFNGNLTNPGGTVSGLTSGTNYTVTVVTVSQDERSEGRVESSRTLTDIPSQVVLIPGIPTNETVTASWDKPAGVVNQYNISCSNGVASPATIDADNNHPVSASCTGLYQAGAEYIMTVTSISGDQTNEASFMLRALPNQVVLREGDSTTNYVSASWDKPAGVVDTYNISCSNGTASPATIDADSDHPVNASCTGLYQAGAEYNMTVTSISGDQNHEATITLRALPNAVVLVEDISTTDSVSAKWVNPAGLVSSFATECSNGTASPSSINVTTGAQYMAALPLPPNLQPDVSTETSVSAVWRHPGGVIDVFEGECSNGTPGDITEDYLGDEDLYQASCENVSTPGDTYLMIVTSISGRQENPATVNLTALPEAVTLREEASSTTAISASWEVPDSVLDTFIITCSDGSASPSEILITSGQRGDTFTASCIDLTAPGEEYTITVVSLSSGIESMPSSLMIITLPEAVTLREEASNTTSITASWEMPNSVLDTFIITCSDGSASPSEILITSDQRGDTLTASCIDLPTPGDEYAITVVSRSSGKESAPSSLGIIALPEAVTLREEASNTTSITASWEMPNSVLDTFIITCSDGSASPSEILITSDQKGDTLTASCIDLPTPGDEYTITVVSRSSGKESAPSSLGIITLPNGVELREGDSTTTSVSALWEKQKETVDNYKISCSEGNASPPTIPVEDRDLGPFNASCVNLPRPGAVYTMIVFSLDGGTSNSSSTIHLRAVPESVESDTIRDYSTTAVNVEWTLKNCDCVYDEFNLIYEPDGTDPITVAHSNQMMYSAQVTGLTQGRQYIFTVVTISGDSASGPSIQTSEGKTVQQRTIPATATNLVITPDQRRLDLKWTKADGESSGYDITVDPIEGQATFNGNLTNPGGTVSGLTSGTNYTVTVVTVSQDERSEGRVESSRTLTDIPSQVVLIPGIPTNETVTASWDKPAGVVNQYNISCSNGVASPATIDADNNHPVSASCTGLYQAGAEYIMTVTSISGDQTNEASFMLRALPNQVVLREGDSTTNYVSASWDKPAGVVDTYNISCSNGTASPATIDADSDHPVNASCTGLYQAGAEYNMTVTSISGDQNHEATITLRALPNAVVLVEDISTTDSVSAKWVNPAGLVSSFATECSNGTASPSSINVTTGAQYMAALPLPPNLQPDVSTETSVSAVWRHPGGVIDVFEGECSNGTPGDITEDYLGDEDLYQASCENVSTPGDTYLMIVTSISGRQENPATVNLTALPEAVTLREEASSTTAISASWEVPDSVLDTFIITCSDGSASPSEILITSGQRGDTFTASCIDLTAPGEEYTITVVSLSSGIESMPSSLMIITLPEAVTLREEASNTTAITASWEVPNSVMDTFNITCSDGSASPSEIPTNSSQRGVALTASCIDLPTPGDEYTITVVSRSNGKESAPSSLGIITLPEAVTLREEASNTTSITASWEMPNSVLDTFIITCSDGSASPREISVTNDQRGDTLTASCIDLPTPGDEYTITVVSLSNGKESAPSSLGIIALPEAVTLREEASNTTSITASWEMPNSVLDTFIITCSDGSASPSEILITSDQKGDTLTASCIDLPTPGEEYTITVVSLSNGKESAPSSLGIIALPEAVTLREEASSTTAITTSWVVPDSVMDTFIITCSDGSASPSEIPITNDQRGDTLTASCIDLPTPGDEYAITVVSLSNGKESAPSSLGIIALPEAVTLREEASNTTSITASWEMPNSVLDTFIITCSDGSASPSEILITSDQRGDTLTASCIDLPTPLDEYTITVVSRSNGKESAPSSLGIITLPNGVELREGDSTTTSVSALWEKQKETVDNYKISCSEGNASPPTIPVEDRDLGPFNASCVNLPRPGAVYAMIVFSLDGGTSNSSSVIHLRAVPESVESDTIRDYNTTAVNVEWTLKSCYCVYDEFNLIYEPDGTDPITVAHSNQMMYSAQVTGLTQGRQYIFTVVTISGDSASGPSIQTSEGKTVQQRTIPATATNLVITPDQRRLDLKWTRADGESSGYDITVDPIEGQATFNGNLTNPGGTVSGLTSGTNYTVTVVTVSQDERSEGRVESSRTLTDTPSQVQNPRATEVNKNTIRVMWKKPVQPNGEITEYLISYVGTRESHSDDSGSYTTAGTSIVIFGLIPGFSYTFVITAVNDGGYSSDPAFTEPVITPEAVPSPVDPDYDYGSITEPTSVSTTSFTITLPEDLFSHENGELTVFTVIISKIGSWGRKRRATVQMDMTVGRVEVGMESCPTGTTGYCNGPLKHNTEYYYAYRAYNGAGAVNSATFGPVATARVILGRAAQLLRGSLLVSGLQVCGYIFVARPSPQGERWDDEDDLRVSWFYAPVLSGALILLAVGVSLAVIGIIAITVCAVKHLRTKKTPYSDQATSNTHDVTPQEGKASCADRSATDNQEGRIYEDIPNKPYMPLAFPNEQASHADAINAAAGTEGEIYEDISPKPYMPLVFKSKQESHMCAINAAANGPEERLLELKPEKHAYATRLPPSLARRSPQNSEESNYLELDPEPNEDTTAKSTEFTFDNATGSNYIELDPEPSADATARSTGKRR
ncbi:tenascin-X-like [Diadema setosum]|uniref:tenascin-X-like n=1 Tax=Diadema setosum TaxID=31175 RepID=UPI003B3B5F4C